jgi:hypothetical protein
MLALPYHLRGTQFWNQQDWHWHSSIPLWSNTVISRATFLWPPTLPRANPVVSDSLHWPPIPQVANPVSWPIPQRANPALTTSLYWPLLPQRANPAVTMDWPPIPQRANPPVTTATLYCPPIPLQANPVISPALNVSTELMLATNLCWKWYCNKSWRGQHKF